VLCPTHLGSRNSKTCLVASSVDQLLLLSTGQKRIRSQTEQAAIVARSTTWRWSWPRVHPAPRAVVVPGERPGIVLSAADAAARADLEARRPPAPAGDVPRRTLPPPERREPPRARRASYGYDTPFQTQTSPFFFCVVHFVPPVPLIDRFGPDRRPRMRAGAGAGGLPAAAVQLRQGLRAHHRQHRRAGFFTDRRIFTARER
jgi:hypothetical protein